ncbi:DNA internalization-related competence protein ComEC/Rec2 [Pseudoalteromonas luteoviolacea]
MDRFLRHIEQPSTSLLICFGIVCGCLISVFYLDYWQLPSSIAMLVFVSSYFKLFSNVLAGFILGIFVTVFHYFTFYHVSWKNEVVDKPVKIHGHVSKIINRSSYTYIKLDVVKLDKFHVSPVKTIYANLSVTKSPQALKEGDEVSGFGKIRLFRSRKNFDVFDTELYAFRNHIHFKGRMEIDEIISRKAQFKKAYQRYMASVFNEFELGWLYYVLLSGDRTKITKEQKSEFRNLGLSHVMAISGLHIGILFSLSFIVFKCSAFLIYSRLSQAINVNLGCMCGALIIAGVYVILSGMQVSAQRAWLMAALGVVCYGFGLRIGLTRIVLYALTLVVVFEPFSLLNIGLYFSFSAVVAILWVLSKRQNFNLTSNNLAYKAKLLIKIQFVVFLFLLPWSVFAFQGVSISGLIVNLIVIPLLGLIIFPAIILQSLVSLFINIPLISPLDWVLNESYLLLKDLKFNWLGIGQLGVPDLGLMLLSIALLLVKPTLRYASIPVILLITRWYYWQPPNWQVDVFDVGHGTAVLVSKEGKGLLYDLGANYFGSYSIFENVILPFIKANNITLVHTVISHDDGDHAGGLNDLIENGFGSSLHTFHGLTYQQPCLKQTLNFEGLFVEVLWPQELQNNDNNNSCVIVISDGHNRLLLPGDIESRSELKLVNENSTALQSTILLAPHHGSNTSSRVEFIEAVDAELVIFSRGYHSPWKLPHRDVIARYDNAGYQMLDTALNGHIQIRIFSSRYQVFMAREAKNLWFLR